MPVVTDYTALLSGDYWNGIEDAGAPVIVTFSFPASAPSYDPTVPGFTAATVTSFQPYSIAEQAQAEQALGEWAAASGLVFVQVAAGQGDINFQNVDLNTTVATQNMPSAAGDGGIGFVPFGAWSSLSYPNFTSDLTYAGDVFMNTQFQNPDGTVNYGTLLHEIGHAIGLKHPTDVIIDGDAEPGPVTHDQVLASNDPSLTIMATVEDTNTGADSHLQQLDMNAAAFLYGAAGTGGVVTTAASGTNSVSNWSWDPATQTMTQTALSDNETVRGTSVNDIINGLPGDRLFALNGTDVLNGGGGNDALYGGPGNSTLIGGPGGNSFYVSGTPTTVIENNVGSSDTVQATVSFTLPANVDTMHLYGAGLTGTGNNDGDTFFGDGSAGQTFIGGTGGDTYHIFNAATTIEEPANGGYDTIFATSSYTLPANVEQLDVFGVGLTATGNNLDDSLFGDPTNGTTIVAGSGNDYMVGQSGNDVLVAGTGSDLMYGEAGANTFVFGSTADAVIGPDPTTIGDFSEGVDQIDLSDITTPGGRSLTFIGTGAFTGTPGQVRDFASGGNTIVQGDVNGDGTPDFEIQLDGSIDLQARDFVFSMACYREGTCILTTRGEVAVENLAIGDQVMTASGDIQPVKWIGYRRVECARHPRPRLVWPVRVRAGAFAENQPRRDLFLSPEHAVFVDGVLIPVRQLINGVTIARVPGDVVTSYHIELPHHAVILAEGLPAESWLDTGNRAMFENGGGVLNLHPTFDPRHAWDEHGAAPLATDELRVRPVWERLAARAGVSRASLSYTDDPAPRLRAGDRVIQPIIAGSERIIFAVPPCDGPLHLISRSVYPTDIRPWVCDERSLGVAVRRIIWTDASGQCEIPVDHPSLRDGWWNPEGNGQQLIRWTNGSAILPIGNEARILEIQLGARIGYKIDSVVPGWAGRGTRATVASTTGVA